MTSRSRLLLFAAIGVLVVGLCALGVWWFVLRSDAPPPVSLEEAAAAVTTTPEGLSAAIEVDGPWTLGEGSFAGYRVEEELANIGFTTAAGRSESIEGSMTITDGVVVSVEVTVDTTDLRSDSNRRDTALRDQALQTSRFPTATFVLTAPITLPEDATSGTAFTVVGTGDLTLHGVTRTVDIPLEAQYVEGAIAVVGSLEIQFADYDIAQPQALMVLSVSDHGVMEFHLLFG